MLLLWNRGSLGLDRIRAYDDVLSEHDLQQYHLVRVELNIVEPVIQTLNGEAARELSLL